MGLFKRFNQPISSHLVSHISVPNNRCGGGHNHSEPLTELRANADAYYWSFFLHAIGRWNGLPKNSSNLVQVRFNNDVLVAGDVGAFS
jgi:hypothetical protein